MNISIKYTNIQSSPSIEKYTHKKIGALAKFVDSIEKNDPDFHDPIQVWVEIGKPNRHHQKGKIFYAECQINLPGVTIRKESMQYDLRVAIDDVKNKMERLLKRYKEKQSAKIKRGAREAKRRGKIAKGAKLRELAKGSRNLYEGN